MNTREQAIAWWNLLAFKAQIGFANAHNSFRFPLGQAPSSITGREIEAIWEKQGRPSSSMVLSELDGKDLMGRIMRVTGGSNEGTYYGFVARVTPKYFVVSNPNGTTFAIGSGKERGGDKWHGLSCELSTLLKWTMFSNAVREKKRRKSLIEDIRHQLDRAPDSSFASTVEQLEAAAKALGLVKE